MTRNSGHPSDRAGVRFTESPLAMELRASPRDDVPPRVLWLCHDRRCKKPAAAEMAVGDLATLWHLLDQGACRRLLVDPRFKFSGGDGQAAMLLVRERFPSLPLVLLARPTGR